MIREDNITLESLTEDLQRDKITLKEYVTRSEHSNLFTTVINKKVLSALDAHPSVYQEIFEVMNVGDGQGSTTRFPNLYGVNPEVVPELSEIPFGEIDETSVNVEPYKFGMRMGISQEMVDDNEVGLINWTVSRLGTRMGILRDQESFKALHTFNITAAALDQSIPTYMGNRNRGLYYTTGAFTNSMTATAMEWEDVLNTGINLMKNQTITIRGETYRIPVYVDTVIANSVADIPLKKILRASTIVVATGIGGVDHIAKTQLAGTNLWQGALKVVTTPYQARGTCYLAEGKRGLVFLERKPVEISQNANWAFDAQEVKATTRFMPAVVEERSMFSIRCGTA